MWGWGTQKDCKKDEENDKENNVPKYTPFYLLYDESRHIIVRFLIGESPILPQNPFSSGLVGNLPGILFRRRWYSILKLVGSKTKENFLSGLLLMARTINTLCFLITLYISPKIYL